MGFKYHCLVFFAIFAIFNCDVTESRRLSSQTNPSDSNDSNIVNSILYNPKLVNDVLNVILQNQGTSVDQINERIIAADGNVEETVNAINSELGEEVFRIDGESLRINFDSLMRIVRNAVQATVRDKLPRNPLLAEIVVKKINEQIDAQSPRLQEILETPIPLEKVQEYLKNNLSNRSKRSLETRDFDLGQLITEIVGNVLRSQLASVLQGLLNNLKAILEDLYSEAATGNDLQNIFAVLKNTLIKRALEVITIVEQFLNGTASLPESRRKRDIEDATSLAETVTGDQGLDMIIRPILTLLATLLTPVNALVKGVISGILNLITPIVGSIILTKVKALIDAIIDLLLPANPI